MAQQTPKKTPQKTSQNSTKGKLILGSEKKLLAAIQKTPDDPENYARLVRLYAHTQREQEALEYLEKAKGSKIYGEIAQLLVDHFYCRSLVAKKLKLKDDIGAKCLQRARKITGLQPSENVGITLSACLIVKNEASNIERCLKSLKPFVDEIVVVDTGSTDNTLEIAKKYGAKIGHHPWNDNFAAARNASLELASGHWALWIDADEEVSQESIPMIHEALMRPCFGGYYIKIINYLRDHSAAEQYVHMPIRLFRLLPGIKFSGRIHEQIIPSLNKLGLYPANLHKVEIYHHGYTPSAMRERNKNDRTINMLLRELQEDPENVFHWFNLANVYAVSHRMIDCKKAAIECTRRLKPEDAFAQLAYQLLACSLTETGEPEEAIKACQEAIERGYDGILTRFELSHALLRAKHYEEALKEVEYCMSLKWAPEMHGDYSLVTYKSHVLKGQILSQLKRYQEAIELFDYALSIDPDFITCLHSKGTTLACLGRDEEAIAYLQRCYQDPSRGAKAMALAAHLHFNNGQFRECVELLPHVWAAGFREEEYLNMWAQCCEQLEDPQLIPTAEKAFASFSTLESALWINWGRALKKCKQPYKALECFQKAIQEAPEDTNSYFNAGDLFYELGFYLEAAEHYEKGLRMDTNHANGWQTLGNCLYYLGHKEGAKTCYEQALRLNPIHPQAKNNLELVAEELAYGTA